MQDNYVTIYAEFDAGQLLQKELRCFRSADEARQRADAFNSEQARIWVNRIKTRDYEPTLEYEQFRKKRRVGGQQEEELCLQNRRIIVSMAGLRYECMGLEEAEVLLAFAREAQSGNTLDVALAIKLFMAHEAAAVHHALTFRRQLL